MKLDKIKAHINTLLGNGVYSYSELEPHLDDVIREMNQVLHAKYPLFSTLAEGALEYTVIPDDYIAGIVIPGCVCRILEIEDEFEQQYMVYNQRFTSNLQNMLIHYVVPRDYQNNVDNTIAMVDTTRVRVNPFSKVDRVHMEEFFQDGDTGEAVYNPYAQAFYGGDE